MNTRPLQAGDLCFILCNQAMLDGVKTLLPTTQCILIEILPKGSVVEGTTLIIPAWYVELLNGEHACIPEYELMRISGNPDEIKEKSK